jgi:probable rRNA maturation factor
MPDGLTVDISIDAAVAADLPAGLGDAAAHVAGLAWDAAARGPEAAARAALAEMSLVITDDDRIRQLNKQYRNRDKATNVLSFSARDEAVALPEGAPLLLGDVVISYETAAREAARHGKTVSAHISHLTVHGVLHLLGYDHETEMEAAAMRARETEILAAAGIADPYSSWVDAAE